MHTCKSRKYVTKLTWLCNFSIDLDRVAFMMAAVASVTVAQNISHTDLWVVVSTGVAQCLLPNQNQGMPPTVEMTMFMDSDKADSKINQVIQRCLVGLWLER